MRRRQARGGPRKTSRANGASAVPTPIHSAVTTPLTSAYPSTYASEAEWDPEDDVARIPISALTLQDFSADADADIPTSKKSQAHKPFRFMDLPPELRLKIYGLHFDVAGKVIDLASDNYKRLHKQLAIFRTCRAIYNEASHHFYGSNTFRVFPTEPGKHFKTKKPLLARLTPRQRELITSLELRLGPGWNKPPRGWVVNPMLGLADCVNVRFLTVFVQCDPSDNVFSGFRKADGFYEVFSSGLLRGVLAEMPHLDRVYFDAWSSVKKSGAMMRGLFAVTSATGRKICWGPERGWVDGDEREDLKLPSATIRSLPGLNAVAVAAA